MVWGKGSTSLFCKWIFSSPSTNCWKEYSFYIDFLWHSCQTLIVHKCKYLFLDSQFYAIDLYVYTHFNTAFSLLQKFRSSFEIAKSPRTLFFLSSSSLTALDSLIFHVTSRVILLISVTISQQGFLCRFCWICGLI